MSRRRYLSTEVSTDPRVNKLALSAGDFAVLLYTWLIPHADDDGGFSADPEKILYSVLPARRDKTPEDATKALEAICEVGLLYRENGRLYFPADAFYRFQTYIPVEKRRSAQNAEKRRETPKNASSLSPSPSPSPSKEKIKIARGKPSHSNGSDPRVKEFFDWWDGEYRTRFSVPYSFSGGKEGALVKNLLRLHDLPGLQSLADRFFKSDDSWVKQNGGYTIGIFASQINKLVSTSGVRNAQGGGVKPQAGKYVELG